MANHQRIFFYAFNNQEYKYNVYKICSVTIIKISKNYFFCFFYIFFNFVK